jgi:hypothetical protein
MQPHLPPVNDTHQKFNGFNPYEGEPAKNCSGGHEWANVVSGDVSAEHAKSVYRSNLGPVLDDVELLLNNVEAETVIVTADHGNYLGENGRWGHPGGHLHPAVRFVPWWTTSATDRETYIPETVPPSNNRSRNEKLEALGYR